jgi:hypothetical protein
MESDMGLHKAIEYGKECRRRWPYYQMVDHWCEHRGRCDYCYRNRTYGRRKNRAAMIAVVADAEIQGVV